MRQNHCCRPHEGRLGKIETEAKAAERRQQSDETVGVAISQHAGRHARVLDEPLMAEQNPFGRSRGSRAVDHHRRLARLLAAGRDRCRLRCTDRLVVRSPAVGGALRDDPAAEASERCRRDAVEKLRLSDEAARFTVGEDAFDLASRAQRVERNADGAEQTTGHEELIELPRVAHETGDPIARPHAVARQGSGEAPGARRRIGIAGERTVRKNEVDRIRVGSRPRR